MVSTFNHSDPPVQMKLICPGNSEFIWDVVHMGDYQILNCGEQASEVVHELEMLYQVLQTALVDVDRRPSSDAFNAFFHLVQNAPVIHDVLKNISTGASVIAAHLLPGFPTIPSAPVIACAVNQSIDPEWIPGAYSSKDISINLLAAAYKVCKENMGERAFIIQGTMMIGLWQAYFQQPFMTPPGNCMAQSTGPLKLYAEQGQTFAFTRVGNPYTHRSRRMG